MSQYYTAWKKTGNFNPESKEPFKISRSKIELFKNCPLCFWMDRRMGVSQPPSFPYRLNSAVDTLLKKEFDFHRAKGSKHPLMEAYKLDAVPFKHPEIEKWRDTRSGIKFLHKPTNLLVYGAVDDIWINPKGELIVVDYKSTSKEKEVSIDAPWQIAYKRQVEIYQWLFKMNNFPVNETAYFVYCNGKTDKKAFDGKLEFNIKLIPYDGNTDWIEETLTAAKDCLMRDTPPEASPDCDYCNYRVATRDAYQTFKKKL